MIKGCIFDLDGVIVDTAKYHYLAWKKLADELGFEFTKSDNERLKGVSRMRSLDILLKIGNKQFDKETKLKFAENKNKEYLNYIMKMTPDEILPGVIEFLEELQNKKIKIALGSASKNAMTILTQLKLTKYFDTVIDGTQVSKTKPNPEVFIKGAQSLNLKPEECLVFEDAEAGIEAAISGNFKSVGIGSIDNLGKANYIMQGFDGITFEKIVKLIN
ncbi:MAG: beta-phosphoglucomutase [Bacteroidales bacterium]|nr:beta-phosphoglucomutase [Bacteroidales bacterium]